MKYPAALSQMISSSDELGQPYMRSQSLLFLRIFDSCILRKNLISLSTKERLTSWSLNTLVTGWSTGRRNPERIWASGQPVMKIDIRDLVHIFGEYK